MSVSLLVLMLLIMAMKCRGNTPLFIEDEHDVRENNVRYDDEGGGEEDTEAFDMVTLRNLNSKLDSKVQDASPETASVNPYSASATSRTSYKTIPDNIVFQEFIWDRLKVTDVDPSAPPYDSLQTNQLSSFFSGGQFGLRDKSGGLGQSVNYDQDSGVAL